MRYLLLGCGHWAKGTSEDYAGTVLPSCPHGCGAVEVWRVVAGFLGGDR